MRCFIDTNILISAGLFPGSIPDAALENALLSPNVAIVCDYSLYEMQRVVYKKFLHRTRELGLFLYRVLLLAERVPMLAASIDTESQIRDVKDRPILRAAIKAKADVLITGDKDFLESTVTVPKMMTPSQFLQLPE